MERRHNVQPQLYRGEIDGARRRETNAILGIYKWTHSLSLSLLHQLFLSKREKRQTWFVEIIWPKSDLTWEKGKKIIKSHWCGWQELWQGFWGEDLTTGGGEVGVGKTGTGEPIVLILIYEILLVNIKGVFGTKLGIKIKSRSATLGFEGKTQWSFKSVQEICIISLL